MTAPDQKRLLTQSAASDAAQPASSSTTTQATSGTRFAIPGLSRSAKVAPEPESGTVPDDSLENYKNPLWKRPMAGEYNAKPIAGKLKTGSTEDKRQGVRDRKAAEQADYERAVAEAKATGKPMPKKPGLHQPVQDLGEIYAHAGMLKAQFEHQVKEIADSTGGTCSFRPGEGMKSINRAMEKIGADYNGDESRLIDATGMSVAYQTPEKLIEGFKALDTAKGLKLVKVKNSAARADGYGDVNLTVEMGGGDYEEDGKTKHWDGFLIELQLHLEGIIEKKKSVHKQYEQHRKIEARHTEGGNVTDKSTWSKSDQKKHTALGADMKAQYGEVWNEYADTPEKMAAMKKALKDAIPERG
jgi:hypothetical protein